MSVRWPRRFPATSMAEALALANVVLPAATPVALLCVIAAGQLPGNKR